MNILLFNCLVDEVSSSNAILISDIRNSLVSRRKTLGNGIGSAFTPITKRVRSEEQTPVCRVPGGLRIESLCSEVVTI